MSIRVQEPAFHGVGHKVGIEIWKIENSKPVPLPNSDHGRFSSSDSYIVLKTGGKQGAYTYSIHFWLGKDASQDDTGAAAVKAVELDAVIGNRAVQYRELEGHESDRFLSYFKPCIIPLDGGFPTESKTPEEEENSEENAEEKSEENSEEKSEEKPEPRLYTCRGKRVARLKQVPFSRSSLNHDEIFILDTKNKIYMYTGANTNVHERSKALDVVQMMEDRYHGGKCNVSVVVADDGKVQTEGPSGEFWGLFGGFAPIGKKVPSDDDKTPDKIPAKLYCIVRGQLQEITDELTKSSLHTDQCYLLYCGTDLYIWVGRTTPLPDKKGVWQSAEEFILKENLPKSVPVTRLGQGHETSSFKSNFKSWTLASSAPVPEETRGKVAALLKQQQGLIKAQAKTTPVEEEVPPLLGENGKIEVWRIDGEEKTQLAKEDIGKFYCGDCYLCLYSYHSNEKKEDHYLCCWIGKDSVEDDQKMAVQMANLMFNSLKVKPVQGRVYQGKEAPQFVAIFQPMVVLKGGLSTGYKKSIIDKGATDETYSPDTAALIEILGTSVHNTKAQQVDRVATSLNSYGCFILQSSTAVSTWYGNQSTAEQQQLSAKVVELLKSGVPVKFSKEGKESLAFWLALGGKQNYTSQKVTQETCREPHLFTILSNKEKLEVEEIYSFEQDDLFPEEVMILDTHADVSVWVGHIVDSKEKQNAVETGQKYIDLAASSESLSPQVPLYRIPEGSEPSFFTTHFHWDPTKSTVQEDAFRKKAVQLFGQGCIPESKDSKPKPPGNKLSGATQRASAMAALTNAFKSSNSKKPKSPPALREEHQQRASAMAALTNAFKSSNSSAPKTPPALREEHQQRASAMAALTNAFKSSNSSTPKTPPAPRKLARGSQRAAAVAALSNVLTAEKKGPPPSPRRLKKDNPSSDSAPASPLTTDQVKSGNVTPKRSENVSPVKSEYASPVKGEEAPSNVLESSEVKSEVTSDQNVETNEEDSSAKETTEESQGQSVDVTGTFTYEQLISKSTNPVTGIDFKKRETYLCDEEFEEIFKMTKEAFYQIPRWKQDHIKKKVDLF